MVNEPTVTVVVPVYNAADTIVECINSLLNLDYPKDRVELIFVDDGSRDNTVELIQRFKGVKLLKQEHRGPAAARNLGFRDSRGEVIAFTDSDCIAPKDWLKRIVKEVEGVDVVGGSLKPVSAGTLAERFEQHRRDRLYGRERRYVDALPSCNLAFKRSVLKEVGGFDEDFKKASAEDYDLCRRVVERGHRILYEPSIYVVHRHVTNSEEILRKAFIHGGEIMLYRRKHGGRIIDEMIKIFVKTCLLPLIVLRRYPLPLIVEGVRYEVAGISGQIIGIWEYMLR
jgi:glycosyltransferase involved in cell wall biosynthesis